MLLLRSQSRLRCRTVILAFSLNALRVPLSKNTRYPNALGFTRKLEVRRV